MSSSGSGVATAAGLCYAAIGTDTGGSIRNPASANGVVGLKPTYGRVSRFGVLAMADSLDHVGPMARSVADVAIMVDAIAGRDPKDPTSLEAPAPQAFKSLTGGIRGVRIGLDRDYALQGIDSGQAAAIDRALQVLQGWATLTNGDLLAAAEAEGFDVLVTTDKNLPCQQNLTGRRLAVVVIGHAQWPGLEPHVALVAAAIDRAVAGSYEVVEIPVG